jgi:hypothetical protein
MSSDNFVEQFLENAIPEKIGIDIKSQLEDYKNFRNFYDLRGDINYIRQGDGMHNMPYFQSEMKLGFL